MRRGTSGKETMLRAQPKGLYLLFFTELWERFGFYALQTILILFMTKSLLMSDKEAYLLYGAFSSLIYFTPVIGGYLADRYIGFQRAIMIGGALFILGYLIMSLPTKGAFFLGLTLVIIANGFFKPNVSSVVGDLYAKDDPRRDGGFTIFYMGINIGALIPPLLTGSIVNNYGWHWGFLLAAFGMTVGMINFLCARHRLKGAGGIPEQSPLSKSTKAKIKFYSLCTAGVILAIAFIHLLFVFPGETVLILVVGSLIVMCRVIFYLIQQKGLARRRMTACLFLILISVGFWAIYNQTFTSLMLFADRNVNKELFGITIDAEFTQFFNPFFIILFSPIFSKLWSHLGFKGYHISIPAKFSLAVVFMAFGYFLLGYGTKYFSHDGEASIWWLISSYGFQTIGELLLSPVGLSMITTLSPKPLIGMMMGLWFLTQSAAFAIGGGLATFANVPEGTPLLGSLAIYSEAFIVYGLISLVFALFSIAMIPFLKDLIKDKEAYP